MSGRRLVGWFGLTLGVAALLLQFGLTLTSRLAQGDSVWGATIFYFSFFTIISNLMLVLVYASAEARSGWLSFWRRPTTRAMMAGAITLVMVFYHVMLAQLWAPQGWAYVADVTLHYVLPVTYLTWWAWTGPHGDLSWRDLPEMLLYPILYLIWAMAYGSITGRFPYPILDVPHLGTLPIIFNCILVFAALLVLYALTIALDRFLARRPQQTR